MALCLANKIITEKNSAPSPCPENSAPLAHEIQTITPGCALSLVPLNLSYYDPPIPAFANLLHMFQPHLGLLSLTQLFFVWALLCRTNKKGKRLVLPCCFIRERCCRLTETAKSGWILKRHLETRECHVWFLLLCRKWTLGDRWVLSLHFVLWWVPCGDRYESWKPENTNKQVETVFSGLTPPLWVYRAAGNSPVVIWDASEAS